MHRCRRYTRSTILVVLAMVIGVAASASEAKAQASATLVGKPYIVPGGRSPIPQPGETLHEVIAPTMLAQEQKPPASEPPASSTTIPWHEAGKYEGQVVTIEGMILRTHNTGKVCFLNFVDHHPNNAFYLIVFEPLLNAWPAPPEQYFLNKKIHATGKIYVHKNKPQIRIEEKSQIKIVKE